MPVYPKPALVTSLSGVHPENLSDNQIKTLFLGFADKNSHFCVADFKALENQGFWLFSSV